MKDSKQKPRLNRVFYISASLIALLVLFGAIAPTTFASIAGSIFNFTTRSFGWFYLLSVFLFVLFLVFLAFSKYGKSVSGSMTFLITYADSATYIISSMTTNGSLNPPLPVRIAWGILLGGIAAVLLIASGLEGLQTASLISPSPFTIILLLMVFTLFKLLRK